jgi:hypothetical protein
VFAVFAAALSAPLARLVPVHATNAPDDSLSACDRRVIPYSARDQVKDGTFLLERSTRAGGVLLYYGAAHSRDPQHPQFAEIEARWKGLKPTVAFYEGPARPIADSATDTIMRFGESGYVRWLARRDGARVERLEPEVQSEVAYLLEDFPPEQVKLFFVLRETSRLREAERMTEQELSTAITALLARAAALKGIDQVITSVEELQNAYRKYWSEPANWWQAPSRWFDPTPADVGGIFTNSVNMASSHFRNLHMYRILAREALGGERVFAVVGSNHVPMQRPALECALADDSSREESNE